MRQCMLILLVTSLFISGCIESEQTHQAKTTTRQFVLNPIGKVTRQDGRTFVVIKPEYTDGLLRLDQCSHVTVLYWFHENDTLQKRTILQVHPRGNKDNPLTGVFATHSPVRPNLIAISRVKVISVKDNIIEIENIDAFDDSPVIDIKS